MNLAQLLKRELQTTSVRALHVKTGLSPSLLKRLVKDGAHEAPELTTLQQLAKAFRLPLWCVLKMAGIELDQPCTQSAFAYYVAELTEDHPLHRQLYERLVDADDDELSELLDYVKTRAARQFRAYCNTEDEFA